MQGEAARERVEMLVSENTGMREKVRLAEEEARERLKEVARRESVEAELLRVQEALGKGQREAGWVQTQLRGKEAEIEELKQTITTIQRAMT